ncbi:MAG: LysR family transcriptional regulator [Alphaproteobacteria bacterium]|nr:LysR family transcriptional regulator [Alphaproteobacteria bacterium]
MHDVDTAFLRTFVTLAETRSFSRTGTLVGRSQSAVSGQIKKLEEIFERQLIERDTRNVRLTPDGEKLLGYARDMIAAADAMLARFRSKDVSGEVRFGSPEDFATAYLPDILAAFTDAHPHIMLHVSCALTRVLIEEFEAGERDLVLIKQSPERLHPGARAIRREELVWVGPATNSLPEGFAEARSFFSERGRPLPLVLSPPACVYRERALAALDRAKAHWTSAFTSPSHAGCAAAVRAGLGYAVMPRGLLERGVRVLHDWPALEAADICLLEPARRSPAAAALAHFIETRMPSRRDQLASHRA